jgi:putative NADPH-quinone reductase
LARHDAGLAQSVFRAGLQAGFGLAYAEPARMPKKLLTGKTARVVVTMGMPAFVYR